jgi:uncharacterized repeat protein (TIGR01451 family)
MNTQPDFCAGRHSGPRLFPSIAGGGGEAIRVAASGAASVIQSRIAPGFQRCFLNRSFIMKFKDSIFRLAMVAGLVVGIIPQAFAQTAAGTQISNQASVDFEVAGVNQADVLSNILQFRVDRQIIVTVAESGGASTQVAPGSAGQVLTFTVTNNSNAILDFALVANDFGAGATPAPFSDTDNFNVSVAPAPIVRVDNPAGLPAEIGVYDAGDTETFIDELAVGGSRTVFIVASIPNIVVNGDTAGMTLTAIAHQTTVALTGAYTGTPGVLAGLAAETNTTVADDPAFIDTVFGDLAGDAAGDVAQDGEHSDYDEYDVVTATITVTKTSTVVSDPFNLLVNPKAIPGAVIEYCFDVFNNGSATATTIILTDPIPANTLFVSGSIKTAPTSLVQTCDVGTGTVEDDNNAGADESDPNGGDYDLSTAGAITVRSPAGIAPTGHFKATYRVTVQ